MNYCDTEGLQALFENAGYRLTDFDQAADVYVINTCTVTGQSDHKSRKAIRRARKRAPGALVVATGCYAQGFTSELESMDQVDLIIGNRDRNNLPELIRSLQRTLPAAPLEHVSAHFEGDTFEKLPLVKRRGRTRGFLKIQDGCDHGCAYCVVPRVRGSLRSLPAEDVLSRARTLTRSGYREIVLTGVRLGRYGSDLSGHSLGSLLKALVSVPGLLRLRLSSIEPSDINAELIEQVAGSGKICPHLHVPLQSGDGEILRRMNRPYEPVEYLYLAQWLKQEIPGLSLGSDVIVGFPGETEAHHNRSKQLVSRIGFSNLHVFKYSPRAGTPAASFSGPVSSAVKEFRSKEFIKLGKKMSASYRENFLGTVQPVLVEKVVSHQYAEGFTPHYLRVRIVTEIKGTHWRGKLINARLEKIDGPFIRAVRVKKNRR